jgi:hypothetical protein
MPIVTRTTTTGSTQVNDGSFRTGCDLPGGAGTWSGGGCPSFPLWGIVASIFFKRKGKIMSMLTRFLLCSALATAGSALAVPTASPFDQIAAGHPELDKNKSTGASSDTQPVAVSAENANPSPSHSKAHAKATKKDNNKTKPAPSQQEEEFNRTLLGIHG